MNEIWNHHAGYSNAVRKVEAQCVADDLSTIDSLFGRDGLTFGDGPEQIKAEALRQLEIEWRSERNDLAEIMVATIKSRQL